MKHIYTLLLAFVIVSGASAQQWNRSNKIAGGKFFDITKAGTDLLAATSDGLYRSSDLGANWTKVNSNIDNLLGEIYSAYGQFKIFHNTNDTLYIFAEDEIHRSTNNGLNWSRVTTPFVVDYNSTFAATSNAIFATSGTGWPVLNTLKKSMDGGTTWIDCDTTSNKVKLFADNGTLYLWGFSGDMWSNTKACVVSKLNASNKIEATNTAFLPANSYIVGFAKAGSNFVALLPDYMGTSSIKGYNIYSSNGNGWTKRMSFQKDGILLQTDQAVYYAPQMMDSLAYSGDGNDWSKFKLTSSHSFSKAISTSANTMLLVEDRNIMSSTQTGTNLVKSNAGFYFPSLVSLAKKGNNIYVAHDGGGVSHSSDNGTTFSDITANINTYTTKIGFTAGKVICFNDALFTGSKGYIYNTQNSNWDTLALPTNNGYMSGDMCVVEEDRLIIHLYEKISTNVYEHKFYLSTDAGANWTNITSSIPQNAFQSGKFFAGKNGDLFLQNEFWGPNGKVVELMVSRGSNISFTTLKHKMGKDSWYGVVTYANEEFYYVKNQYTNPDSLFVTKNDSLVLVKRLTYGNFQFYNANRGTGGLIINGSTYYSLGIDTLNDDLTIIRSLDAGNTWTDFTTGFTGGTEPAQMLIDGSDLLLAANNGFWTFGTAVSSVSFDKKSDGVLVYPNPATNLINIKIENSANAGVSLFDMTGQLKLQTTIDANNSSMRLSNISSGMYILKIVSEGKIVNKKIVVE